MRYRISAAYSRRRASLWLHTSKGVATRVSSSPDEVLRSGEGQSILGEVVEGSVSGGLTPRDSQFFTTSTLSVYKMCSMHSTCLLHLCAVKVVIVRSLSDAK